jgi:repressor of nif and glnA expression
MEPSQELQEMGIEQVIQISAKNKEILAFQLKNRMMGVVLQGILYMPLDEQNFEKLVVNKIEGPWYYYYEKN